jgi:hypothetical protein
MTLAAVLSMNGYFLRMEKDGTKCIWILDPDDEDHFIADFDPVEDLVERYIDGDETVEPKKFMRELSIVRRKMYRFLGIGDKPHGSRVDPPAE